MEQVYFIVGFAVTWTSIVIVAAIALGLVGAYIRGFYRSIKFTRWAVKNAAKTKITPWIVVKNVFYSWNEQTWATKSDSWTASNGSKYTV